MYFIGIFPAKLCQTAPLKFAQIFGLVFVYPSIHTDQLFHRSRLKIYPRKIYVNVDETILCASTSDFQNVRGKNAKFASHRSPKFSNTGFRISDRTSDPFVSNNSRSFFPDPLPLPSSCASHCQRSKNGNTIIHDLNLHTLRSRGQRYS